MGWNSQEGMPEVLEPEMDCKGVIGERILTASQGIVARGRECGRRRHVWIEFPGTRLPSCSLCQVEISFLSHRAVVKYLAQCPVVDNSSISRSYCFSGQGEMVPPLVD